MTPIYIGITLVMVVVIFFVTSRGRGALFALGASLFTLILLGAAYFALVALITSSM